MSVLLHLDSSPLGTASISRQLSVEYALAWSKANPSGYVLTRDLTTSSLPVIDAAWIVAANTPAEARSDEQKRILALSDTLISELRVANEYVIGVPMHNFTVPSSLRLWIDLIARSGETFSYSSNGPEGLLKNKKATFVVATGGYYDEGTPMASFNFIEPYLRTVFSFLGVHDVHFHTVGGAMAVAQGKVEKDEFLKAPIAAIQADFQSV